MKELSVEEKAKAYDKALERAKKEWSNNLDNAYKNYRESLEIIFPELKESEDEKVRKSLFEYFKNRKDDGDADETWYGISYDEILAWLEKQSDIIENNMLLPFKEYDNLMDSINKKKKEGYEAGYKQGLIDSKNDQHVQPKFKVGDTIRVKNSLAEYVITDIYGGCYHGKGWSLDIISADRSGDYELVEQNHAWSEEDEDYRQDVNAAVDNYFDEGLAKELCGWLKSLKDRVQPQPKQEWSEEDEKGLGNALWAIQQARTIAKDENDMGNLWYAERFLKSLKDRVLPQPTQEWSEEDKEMFNTALDMIEWYSGKNESKSRAVSDWFKSLKERYTWKPSDEQMKFLWKYAEQNNYDGRILTLLYNDLKKLKG